MKLSILSILSVLFLLSADNTFTMDPKSRGKRRFQINKDHKHHKLTTTNPQKKHPELPSDADDQSQQYLPLIPAQPPLDLSPKE